MPLNRIPILSINYDSIPVLHPEFFTPDAVKNFERNLDIFKRSVHVFSISETSRADLINISGIHPSRTTAIMIDIDPCYRPATAAQIARARRRNGLERRSYIICVGTLEPRKNHNRLLRAFVNVNNERHGEYDLVIVGKTGWGATDLNRLAGTLGLSQNIHFLSDLPNAELGALYSGALFSVYPSLYEGFGLPVIESMACGCPVITSNISSMPEIAGDAALYVDPTSIESIGGAMRLLMQDADLRKSLTEKGLARRSEFSWTKSAGKILAFLERNRA